jgi:hypothetical protein
MQRLLHLTILLVGIGSEAEADPIPMSPELSAFLVRPDQERTVVGMMFQQWRVLVENCPTPQLKQTKVFINNSPTFGEDGIPLSGEWRVIGQVEGCGEHRTFNILYGFTTDGKMVRLALLPGTTVAGPRLQKDSLFYATMGMIKIAPPNCKDIQYTDTKFIQFGEENPSAMQGRDKRSWTEEWTVRACGVTGIVTMQFVPDAHGTAITPEPNKTRQIGP